MGTRLTINDLFETTVQNKASDLHVIAGIPPMIRIDGKLHAIGTQEALTHEVIEEMIFSILTPAQKEYFFLWDRYTQLDLQ